MVLFSSLYSIVKQYWTITILWNLKRWEPYFLDHIFSFLSSVLIIRFGWFFSPSWSNFRRSIILNIDPPISGSELVIHSFCPVFDGGGVAPVLSDATIWTLWAIPTSSPALLSKTFWAHTAVSNIMQLEWSVPVNRGTPWLEQGQGLRQQRPSLFLFQRNFYCPRKAACHNFKPEIHLSPISGGHRGNKDYKRSNTDTLAAAAQALLMLLPPLQAWQCEKRLFHVLCS